MYSIELDEQLVNKAMAVSGEKSRLGVIYAALRNFIKTENRKKILAYQGKGIWDGNLNELRATR